MKFFGFLFVTLLLATTFSFSQSKSTKFAIETNYDARLFLGKTQAVAFNRLYIEFDNAKAMTV